MTKPKFINSIRELGKAYRDERKKRLKKTKSTDEPCNGDCPLCDTDKYYAKVNLYDLEVWQDMVQTLAKSHPDNKVYWNEWLKTIKRYKQEIHEMFKSLRSK